MRPKKPLQTDGQDVGYTPAETRFSHGSGLVRNKNRHHRLQHHALWLRRDLNRAVDVEYAKTDLEEDLNQAINDVVASSTFATASSTRVTNSVTGLKPHILAILDKLVDNKPGFTSAGVISIVKADLQSLQNLTNVYSTDIQAKVTTAGKATISSVVVEVNAAYFSTTTAFY
ncbi:hypothetical protein ACMYSQ_012146 [Aspergillus niger]